MERRLGFKFGPARPFRIHAAGRSLRLAPAIRRQLFSGPVRAERADQGRRRRYRLKSGLRRVVEEFQPELRLTPSQNILLVNVEAAKPGRDHEDSGRARRGCGKPGHGDRAGFDRLPGAADLRPGAGGIRARAFPRCSRASNSCWRRVGLRDEEIIIRMTGCPNGCARPLMAEMAFVGRAPGKYQLYLGGNVAEHAPGPALQGEREERGIRQRTAAALRALRQGTAAAASGLAISPSACCSRGARRRAAGGRREADRRLISPILTDRIPDPQRRSQRVRSLTTARSGELNRNSPDRPPRKSWPGPGNDSARRRPSARVPGRRAGDDAPGQNRRARVSRFHPGHRACFSRNAGLEAAAGGFFRLEDRSRWSRT